jgi:hypothetical protein
MKKALILFFLIGFIFSLNLNKILAVSTGSIIGSSAYAWGENSDSSNTTTLPLSSPSSCNATKPGSSPSLLGAVDGTNSVILTWSKAVDPVTKYLVAYGTSTGSIQYGNPNVGGANTTNYTVKGLSGGVRYYFRVKAINDCMPGDFSNEISSLPTGKLLSTPAENFIPSAPDQLFDIAFIVDGTNIAKASDLVSRVTFISFGNKPTPVEITFTIVDMSGKEYYRSIENTTIQTEGVFNKNFPDLKLSNGKYQIVLNTLYNTNVRDEFKQDFEIGSTTISFGLSQTFKNTSFIVTFCLALLFILIWLIALLSKRQTKKMRTKKT